MTLEELQTSYGRNVFFFFFFVLCFCGLVSRPIEKVLHVSMHVTSLTLWGPLKREREVTSPEIFRSFSSNTGVQMCNRANLSRIFDPKLIILMAIKSEFPENKERPKPWKTIRDSGFKWKINGLRLIFKSQPLNMSVNRIQDR